MPSAHPTVTDLVAQPAPAPPRTRINPASVRSLDIRGVVGVDVDAEDARLIGGAYAALAQDAGLKRIGVGRDGRLSSPEFEGALVEGLVAGGMDVIRIGVGPTPMLAYAVRSLGLDGGIMVTASHNPPPENGFKLLLGADRIHGEALQALIKRAPSPAPGGQARLHRVLDAYVEQFRPLADGIKPLSVVWDAGSGASGEVLERLIPHLPGRHVLLNTAIDGRFPAHHADPAVEANMRQLQAAVVEHGCDLGIAFDGDADRIGAVDGDGAMVWADQLLLLLAEDLLQDHPGATLVADVKCSLVLFDGVRAHGGRAVMAPSGYVLVRDTMRREGALLGGELSGHVFYSDGWDGTDDAIYVALRLLRALSRSERSLADFRRSLPRTVITPEYRISCPQPRKAAVVAEVSERLRLAGADVERCDGLRVNSADGWWLLRASNTENKLTCRVEAADEAGLQRLLDQLRTELAASGVSLPA